MGNSKGTRHQNKRKVNQAISAIDNASLYFVMVGRQYEEAEPELYSMFCNIIQTLDLVKKASESLYDAL